jgi:tRNA-dihydrouridine synthase B
LGLRVARKHLGWFMDRCATPEGLRKAVLTAPDVATTDHLLQEACTLHGKVAA